MLYFVLCIIFVFNTIKFTLELSSGDYLYFAVCILCFVSCIQHFYCCILYFVLLLYSTPSSSRLSSPQWTICNLCFVFYVLYLVFYILKVVFCAWWCFCSQHHQVHLGALLR